MLKGSNIIRLMVSVGACLLAGFIGSAFTAPAIPGWYASLVKPPFNPPNFVFAPVWTTLYLLMGFAAFLVWASEREDSVPALYRFALQLVLNAAWSMVFFGLRSPIGGLVVIALLWYSILMTIIWFARVSRPAAWLLGPYILWVSFAAVLNLSILVLNR